MARFTVRVKKGDRLFLCVQTNGAEQQYLISTEQADKVATMLNFRSRQIDSRAEGAERLKMFYRRLESKP